MGNQDEKDKGRKKFSWSKAVEAVGFVLLSILLVLILVGVYRGDNLATSAEGNNKQEASNNSIREGRFSSGKEQKLKNEGLLPTGEVTTVVTDRQTGCNYLVVKSGDQIAMTVLLDKKGKTYCTEDK